VSIRKKSHIGGRLYLFSLVGKPEKRILVRIIRGRRSEKGNGGDATKGKSQTEKEENRGGSFLHGTDGEKGGTDARRKVDQGYGERRPGWLNRSFGMSKGGA